MGLFDRVINQELLMKYPALYIDGIKQRAFTTLQFSLFMLDSLYQSAVCYFIPFAAYYYQSASSGAGIPPEMEEMGTVMAWTGIICADLIVALNTHAFTWIQHLAIWASVALVILYTLVYSAIPGSNMLGYYQSVYGSGIFWFTAALTFLIALFPRYFGKVISRFYRPTDIEILQEEDVLKPKTQSQS